MQASQRAQARDNMEAVIIACAAAKFVARERAAESCRFEN
jgi:hypothetical protein